MWSDPMVEEVRKVRNAHARKFNYDLQAIVADLRNQQKASKRKFVTLAPKKACSIPTDKSRQGKIKPTT